MSGEQGVEPTAALAAAVAAAVAATGAYQSWWSRRRTSDDAVATQIKEVVDASLALAEERRAGEHDCHEQLAALRTEMRTTTAELRAKVDDCERKHAEVAARLAASGYPPQHGPA